MSVNQDHFRELLEKYANKQASPEELEELFALISDHKNDKDWEQIFVDALENNMPVNGDEQLWDQQFDQMLADAKSREFGPDRQIGLIGWRRLAIAASVLLFLSTGAYFLLHKPQQAQQVAKNQKQDIDPGSNKATLTLANGQKIYLSKNSKGQLAVQGQTQIQTQNGVITYDGKNDTLVAYNTLTTKRKEEFSLVLSDGTEVMLDAASSITYPVAFNGRERRVKITGQAYFKVVHNDRKPFVVEAKGQNIRDIGTEFNINAYDDEPVTRTTLVSGSIAVAYNNETRTVKPGQEADLANNKLSVRTGNIDEATAWKNHLFHFTGMSLQAVMRQFSRWYDVDVIYRGDIPDHAFAGEIPRDVKASEVFDALSGYGLQFQIDGKQVIISKAVKNEHN